MKKLYTITSIIYTMHQIKLKVMYRYTNLFILKILIPTKHEPQNHNI